jgi:hypothetical protein
VKNQNQLPALSGRNDPEDVSRVKIARVLIAAMLLIGACAGGSDATMTTSGTQPHRSEEIDQLEDALAAALDDLAAAEEDLEQEAARLEADLSRAREEARRSVTEAALAVESLEQLESLVAAVRADICAVDPPTFPTSFAADLMEWLIETQSAQGDVPAGTAAIIGSAVTADGWWLFRGEFTGRFEPGVFVRDPGGDFAVVWGGIAASEAVIRAWIHGAAPEMPAKLASCLDVSGFVDQPAQ